MTFMYFAYGSNMLTTRLRARCDSAKFHSKALVCGYKLEFTKKSRDGSGKATLTKSDSVACTPGVIFRISESQSAELDRFEGAGNGYDRVADFQIEAPDGPRTATTYLATAREDLLPYDWYLALVIAGAMEHGLGDSHIMHLRAQSCRSDPCDCRDGRKKAIKALHEAEHFDYRSLLGD